MPDIGLSAPIGAALLQKHRDVLRYRVALADAVPGVFWEIRRAVAVILADPRTRADTLLILGDALLEVAADLANHPPRVAVEASTLADLRKLAALVQQIAPAKQ